MCLANLDMSLNFFICVLVVVVVVVFVGWEATSWLGWPSAAGELT